MERSGMSRLAIAVLVATITTMMIMADATEGSKPTPLRTCYGDCYTKCDVTKPLWCAALCLGKCKHGKSIPDNICNCTYTCSKFMCAGVGSDPEKIRRCVFKCSHLCNIKY